MFHHYLIGKNYSQDEIDKATELAYQSELQLANEIGKYKGYHELMYTKAAEIFKPITQSTSMKMKQETIEDTRKDIQNDPNLSSTDKLQLMSKLDKIKLEKYTTDEDRKLNPEDTRKQEIADAFRVQNDFIFGLVDIPENPGEYIFGVLNLLDNLNMMSPNREVLNHHRIRFNNSKVEVIANLYTDKPLQLSYPYSKDLLWLLTQNTLEGSATAKQHYMDIIEKCLRNDLERHRFAIRHSSHHVVQNYDDFLNGVKDNEKFVKWISVKYKMPLRVQPRRNNMRTEYSDTSVYKYPDEDTDEDTDEEGSQGEGIAVILSPNANDRIKRAFVLLGNRKSSKDDNPVALEEFTAILDTLLNEGTLSIKKYKLLMKKWRGV